ncbi:hypothetical protein CPB85DRAFT_1240995 [Mucidula mucida]|nr:hypothetical protein CPB85DRAFT_1240995 [Mucidula mucida]
MSSLDVLVQSFSMILVSEVGDKTFLIAAILAMRHPRLTVFLGAFVSLIFMSVLSAAMGHILPAFIPRLWTQTLAGVLFLVFGTKMLVEGRNMKGGHAEIDEEMREAEQDINGDEKGAIEKMEEGEAQQQSAPPCTGFVEGARNFFAFFLGPIFVQTFVLTFVAEWGDRSQIATIALGAAHNMNVVAVGTILGHSCCSALAVVGGRYFSTKISVKQVTLGGACLFLVFGVIYLYQSLQEILY